MTSRSDRDRSQLALRARYGGGEIAFEARERFAVGAVVVLIVVLIVVVALVVMVGKFL